MQLVVDGLLTSYQIVGKDEKTILILHGWQRSLSEWMPVAKKLAQDYTVILLDLPGFGLTPRPKESYSIYDYAKFVEHFLNKLEIKKVMLIGHSFGGRIGIILGSKSRLLDKLILVDAAAVEKKSLLVQAKITFNKLAILPVKLFFPHQVEEIKNKFGSDDYQTAGNMRDIFIKTVNEDLTPLLSKIEVPTLVIWGEKDSTRPLSEGKLIKDTIHDAKLRVVWGAGHSPYLEKPRKFVEILEENLKMSSPKGSL